MTASSSSASACPSAARATTIAGICSDSVNLLTQSPACVDSAEAGRKVDWSLEETSLRLPKVGPPTADPASQASTSTTAATTRSAMPRPRWGREVPEDVPAPESLRALRSASAVATLEPEVSGMPLSGVEGSPGARWRPEPEEGGVMLDILR